MPRLPDPELESRILNAAQRLWKTGGERALSMRAVARAAGTNTPAVYRRFKDRDDILRALLQRVRLEFARLMENAPSPQKACERYLDFALANPHEYELFFRHNYDLYHSERSKRAGVKSAGQPARDAMKRKLAGQFGGSPDDHEKLVIALWMVGHGAAMLILAKTILPEDVKAARAVFRASVLALLKADKSRR